MRDLLPRLENAVRNGAELAICRLLETRGSTPQKAGACMVVFPDGSQLGTLGGGCVEAEVRKLAVEAVSVRSPRASRFQLDHDYGWDDGLICGGRMDVLIDPLPSADASVMDYYHATFNFLRNGRGFTEAIALSDGKPMGCVFDESGRVVAKRGKVESSDMIQKATQVLRSLNMRPRPYVSEGISFLPTLNRVELLIVGGGHVGKAVADLAHSLDFDVSVYDDRPEFVSEDRFSNAKRFSGDLATTLRAANIDSGVYGLVVTRGHNHDQEAVFHLAGRGAGYLGLIGSRRKIRMIFENLLQEGIPRESLESIYAPVGIEIGSQTVPEIALSICAELVSHRNLEGRIPGRPKRVEF